MAEERKKVWIDRIQTKLFLRISMYWIVYQACLWNLLFMFRLFQEGQGDPLEQYGRFAVDCYPVIVGSMLLFPVLAWDLVKFAHRVVGPIYRFRRTLQALAAGEQVSPVKLRKDDLLNEMRDEFNQLLETLQRQGLPVLKPVPEPEPKKQPA